jgi:hypothetical protein
MTILATRSLVTLAVLSERVANVFGIGRRFPPFAFVFALVSFATFASLVSLALALAFEGVDLVLQGDDLSIPGFILILVLSGWLCATHSK